MHRGTVDKENKATCITPISIPNTPTTGPFPVPPSSSAAAAAAAAAVSRYHYHPQNYHHLDITVTVLWVLTPFLSTASVAIVCVAVTTNHWLLTQENMSNPNYNGTGDREYLPKGTISGLWTLCYTNPGEQDLFCSNIDYFPNEEYSPDPNDSTMAIPYTVTKSAAFFIIATLLLFLGEFSCIFGHFSRQRRLFTFISGVIFIISGLLMLIGLVMYISIFKAEIGGKLRPRSQLQPAVFTFKYGFSFILYVTGFVSTEISGTCAVFLYIYWHQKEWRKKRSDLRRKFSAAPSVLLNVDSIEQMYPLCRRHPQYSQPLYISSNNIRIPPPQPTHRPFSPILARRFYLDRDNGGANSDNENPPSPTCLKHGLSHHDFLAAEFSPRYGPGKQNRKVGTDDLNEDFPPPPPEAYHYQWLPTYEQDCCVVSKNYFPRDATTNTVSTIADIEIDEDDDMDDYSPSILHEHEFVPFDLDANPITVPPPSSTNSCELEICNRRDDFRFETLRRTTPV